MFRLIVSGDEYFYDTINEAFQHMSDATDNGLIVDMQICDPATGMYIGLLASYPTPYCPHPLTDCFFVNVKLVAVR